MNSKTIISIFLAFIVSFGFVMVDFFDSKDLEVSTLADMNSSINYAYRVYLEGNSIGLVNSKEKLENYIDKEQQAIKDKYKVDKVYAPNDLDIVREYTYNEEILPENVLYNKIKEIKGTEAFTINGYEIFIEGIEETTESGVIEKKDVMLYVLDKTVFEKATESMITAFIDSSDYRAYLDNTQKEIVDTGSIIQNLYIQNKISVTEKRIPSGEKIYTDANSLAQILIFGEENKRKNYSIKAGDNIESVSDANQMSPEEFLIANPNFKSKDDLLYPGQIVTLGILAPQFNIVEEVKVVEEMEIAYTTRYEDDPNQYTGYEKVN